MKSFLRRLQRALLSFILVILLCLPAFSYSTVAQALTKGDVAFSGMNVDNNENFAIVVLKNIAGGRNIHFSNEEWNGSFFSGKGGHLTWVAPSGGVPAGTVVVFNHVSATPTVTMGSIKNDADFGLSSVGDVIYAYTGADQDTPDIPFLGAIATAADEYNQPDGTEGTLKHTGLTMAGNETILLADNYDNGQYTGDRSGNTKKGYLTLLNYIDTGSPGKDQGHDNWDQFNGDDESPFPPYNTQKFKLVSPPTIAFTTDAQAVTEGSTATLRVKLLQANNGNVSVDVNFLSSSSSAGSDDIDNQISTPVQFTNASSGATKDVTITVPANHGFEGSEKAVFQLQHNTNGSIISPGMQTLTIKDSKTPEVVINEILYDPTGAGDANNDGKTDGTDDEFVEMVNTSGHYLDISNWTLSDASSIKYTFKKGTIIPPDKSFVVFASHATGTIFGGAYLFSSGNSLSFNNSGDDVIIKNAAGDVVTSYHYSGSESNESITRNPDITGDFVGHREADTDDQSPFSPGTKIDGTPFGSSSFAMGIRGRKGWRFVASPTKNTTFKNLFGNLWIQGVPNSDAPTARANLYGWRESGGGAFSPLGGSGMQKTMQAGKGYILYVFKDDNFRSPGMQGGFPKSVGSSNQENPSPVQVSVSSTDNNSSGGIDGNEGYNLLGNPYGTDISISAVINALSSVNASVNANVYIYDPNAGSGNGEYVSKSSGIIAPFQAFFIRYSDAGVNGKATFNRSDLAAGKGTQLYGKAQQAAKLHQFKINLGDGNIFDSYKVEFNDDGKAGEDRWDAYKLFSLNAHAINLYSTVGDEVKLAKNVLPAVTSIKNKLSIPLFYQTPHSGQFTFSWDNVDDIPQDMDLYLVDHQADRKINLRTTKDYSFNVMVDTKKQQTSSTQKVTPVPTEVASADNKEENSRFEIVAVPSSVSDNKLPKDEQKEEVNVSHNYPNPFTPQSGTTMDVSLKHKMHVTMTIYNIVGQKIKTICDEVMDKGSHSMSWSTSSNTPSGIYLCKIKAGSNIITRKMTLVK